MPANPASAVRGPKHVVKAGKTPVLEMVTDDPFSTFGAAR